MTSPTTHLPLLRGVGNRKLLQRVRRRPGPADLLGLPGPALRPGPVLSSVWSPRATGSVAGRPSASRERLAWVVAGVLCVVLLGRSFSR